MPIKIRNKWKIERSLPEGGPDVRKETVADPVEACLDAAITAGCIALENGAETVRCESTIDYMLQSSGAKQHFADVTSATIIASADDKIKAAKVSRWGTDLNRVCMVNAVSRDLCSGKITALQAADRLEQIRTVITYSLFKRLGAYALVAVFLPLFTGSNPYNCIAALFNGLIMGLAGELFSHIRIRYFVVNLLQGFLMVLMTDLFVFLSQGAIDAGEVLAASITPMLPGIALTNGVRDTLSGDYLSGLGRMAEALLKALSAALGVAAGLSIERLLSFAEPVSSPSVSPELLFVLQIAASYLIAVGYAIIMVNPPRSIWLSALVGAAGRLTYQFLVQFAGLTATMATFIATALIALSGNLMARKFRTPAIVYLISGIMSIVPGASLYNAVQGFVFGDIRLFEAELINTLMISGAIAVSIFLVESGFRIYTMARNKTLFIR